MSCVTVFLLLGCGGGETENRLVLATVGEKQISRNAFERRLRHFTMLTPIDEPHVRQALLQCMVDEKILLSKAEARGWRELPDYQDFLQRVSTDAVLDAYKDVVADTQGVVNEAEVVGAFALQNEKVHARHLFAPTRAQADRLYERLQAGASFEMLAAEVFQDQQLRGSGGDLGYFAWEEVDQAFARAAQQLKAGEISPPVRTRYGYSIIKLEDRFRNPILTESEYAKNKERLHWELRHQKRAEALRVHGRNILKDLAITYNPATLELLWHTLSSNHQDSAGRVEPESPAFAQVDPSLPVATVAGQVWTVKDVQARARWTSARQRRAIRSEEALVEFLNGLALRDELLREARAQGLERDSRVQAAITERAENFLITKMRQAVLDTVRVPVDSMRAEYERNPKAYVFPAEVNLREIVVGSQEEAEMILAQIRGGADFAKLAQQYSLRMWSKERGGEVGYVAKGELGQLGEAIFALPMHGIGGPYAIGRFCVIVQVLGMRAQRQKTFEQAKAELEENLIHYAQRAALKKQVQDWRQGYYVEMDTQGLGEVRSPLAKSD